jgi:hypothetical protein
MSAVEHPERHRCVVSIAGVTDLQQLLTESRAKARIFAGDTSKFVKSMIGQDPAVIDRGSPQNRVEYIEYEDDDHQLRRETHRIDMLKRIGSFLEENLAPREPETRLDQ